MKHSIFLNCIYHLLLLNMKYAFNENMYVVCIHDYKELLEFEILCTYKKNIMYVKRGHRHSLRGFIS